MVRTRQSPARSDLGAMLCFDQHNIRYISATVIGEWARDKLIRYSEALKPGASAARIEEEVVLTPAGAKIISLYPAQELPVANAY